MYQYVRFVRKSVVSGFTYVSHMFHCVSWPWWDRFRSRWKRGSFRLFPHVQASKDARNLSPPVYIKVTHSLIFNCLREVPGLHVAATWVGEKTGCELWTPDGFLTLWSKNGIVAGLWPRDQRLTNVDLWCKSLSHLLDVSQISRSGAEFSSYPSVLPVRWEVLRTRYGSES